MQPKETAEDRAPALPDARAERPGLMITLKRLLGLNRIDFDKIHREVIRESIRKHNYPAYWDLYERKFSPEDADSQAGAGK